MPRRASVQNRRTYERSYRDTRQRTGCSRCGTVGAILLAVLGLPLVIYNAPACFFADGFVDEYYNARAGRIAQHNASTAAWRSEGRFRCLDHLFDGGDDGPVVFVRVAVTGYSNNREPVLATHSLVPLARGDMIPDLFEDLEGGDLSWPAPLRLVNQVAFDLARLESAVGSDAALQFELFSAARVGCDQLGEGLTTGTCEPIHTVRAPLMLDRMSRDGESACSQIVAPGRGDPDHPPQVGGGQGSSLRWCALRAVSFLLPKLRNATHPTSPVVSDHGRPKVSGFQTGELFASLGNVNMPSPTGDRSTWGIATAAQPPLMYREGENMYSYGRSWDSAAIYTGQDGSHKPSTETGRFDILVRCADDPYVMAAESTSLSMDFGTWSWAKKCPHHHSFSSRRFLRDCFWLQG